MSGEAKDVNPKDAVGTNKVSLSVLSCPVLMEVALGTMEGARKYGRHNWRAADVRASIYYDAAQRHLMAWQEGENIDAGSGLSHITKAIAGLMILRDAQIRGAMVDDRPPATFGFIDALNDKAGTIIEMYPVCLPAVVGGDPLLDRDYEESEEETLVDP